MGLEPTISCLGSKRSTTELHPRFKAIISQREERCQYECYVRHFSCQPLLVSFQQPVCQLEQCITCLTLWVRLPQTQERQVGHLLGCVGGGLVATLAGQQAGQFLHFAGLDGALLPACGESSVGAKSRQH